MAFKLQEVVLPSPEGVAAPGSPHPSKCLKVEGDRKQVGLSFSPAGKKGKSVSVVDAGLVAGEGYCYSLRD